MHHSFITVDHPTRAFQAAVDTLYILLPGTVLLTSARPGNPWEIKVLGQGLI